MLRVRALPAIDPGARVFMGLPRGTRRLRAPAAEHLLIEQGGAPVRLDVVEGTVAAGPFSLRFDLPDDDRLEERLTTIHIFRGGPSGHRLHLGLARRLLALLAVDARDAGASLREVAARVLGPGDWPGDGEHRKSAARRLVGTGARMLREGPRPILAGHGGARR